MMGGASTPVGSKAQVLVVQRRMTHYRVPFFERLRDRLQREGITLLVAYGTGTAQELAKRDEGDLAWAERLETRYGLGGRLCWQPFSHLSRAADLVIVTAENKLLANLPLQWASRRRVALWGHGANLQGRADSLREVFKRRMARSADWWFAYTDLSVPRIVEAGFPRARISVVDNAIDTAALAAHIQSATPADLAEARRRWALRWAGPTGLFMGSLYAEKRLDMLLAAGDALHRRIPGFELLVVGDGPERQAVQAYAEGRPWIHALGALRGRDKALALALSDVILNPGLVGLGVLDSFVAGVPLVTTDCGLHSPEIAYLASGENGWITPDSVNAFTQAATTVLLDTEVHGRLAAGCRRAATRYTLDHMVERFASGVVQALAAPPYRPRASRAAS